MAAFVAFFWFSLAASWKNTFSLAIIILGPYFTIMSFYNVLRNLQSKSSTKNEGYGFVDLHLQVNVYFRYVQFYYEHLICRLF